MARLIEVMVSKGVNAELLREELRAAFGDVIAGTSRTPRGTFVAVEGEADIPAEALQAVVDAHDPGKRTALQAAHAAAASAPDRARTIPGWATWDETQALAHIEAHVTDLASAKVVLAAMARIMIALRDATWPTLGVE